MANRNMEAVLQNINKNFVTVADGDIKETNCILAKVLDEITIAIRSVSTLFNNLFETYIYGGSFYDGLKVSKPDEFDIDLKLLLPKILDVQLEPTDRDGFVYVKLKDWNRFQSDKDLYNILSDLEKLKDNENYLSHDKVKRWMQGIVQQAINKIRETGALDGIELKSKMSGPAVTLKVKHSRHEMDIDLVAVFRITGEKWPESPVRQNTNLIRKDFLVVPKGPKDVVLNSERYWRLSFPEQEKDMILGLNYCKPALRLLKKLRDTRDHNIPSYFIKTVFLWEIENRVNDGDVRFWDTSLTHVFLTMLKIYKNSLEKHEIPYFWSERNNFLQLMSDATISNLKDYLDRVIKDIYRYMDTDPYVVAKHLLPQNELEELQAERTQEEASTPNWEQQEPTATGQIQEPTAICQTQEQPGMSPGAIVATGAAVAIGAAILGGLFAFSRSRNRDN